MQIYRVSDWSLNQTIVTNTYKLASCKYSNDNKIVAVGLPYYGTFDSLGNLIYQDNTVLGYERVAAKGDNNYYLATNNGGFFY